MKQSLFTDEIVCPNCEFSVAHESVQYHYCPIIAPDNVYGVIDLEAFSHTFDGVAYKRVDRDWFRTPPIESFFLGVHDGKCIGILAEGAKTLEGATMDTRRIIMEPTKPKTRRVLVGEWAIEDGLFESVSPKGKVYPDYANNSVEYQPHVYRIEERKESK